MKNRLRATTIALATLLFATACAGHNQRVSESAAPEPPPAVPAPGAVVPPATGMRSLTEGLAPIPDHPPVTMSGLLKGVDPKLAMITFEDGRAAMLSDQSEILVPADVDKVGRGTPIVVRNALPVGVWSKDSAAPAGKRERMATVESVDESDQVVRLTDGTTVRVPPTTPMHFGIEGPSIDLADVHPGDEIVMLTIDDAVSSTRRGGAAPSASPRSSASGSPRTASEVMIFRPVWTP
jgi:hypothetical protein